MNKSTESSNVTVAIIIAAAIIISTLIVVVSLNNDKSSANQGDTVLLSAKEFEENMIRNMSTDYTQMQSSCSVANSGDLLIVRGEVTEVGCVDDDLEAGFIYSYVTLKESSSTGIDFFFLGNLTDDIEVGDAVDISLHVIDCDGSYTTFWGDQIILIGEFLIEDFYYGMYITQPMIPRNNIQKI